MPRIFVSHAQENREDVAPFVTGLQDAGLDVWWDGDLRGGDDWSARIEAELQRSDCVVIFWSRQSVKSPWVRIEAHYARQHQNLVPVRLDDVELPDEYRMVQTIDGTGSSTQAMGALVSAVQKTLRTRRQQRIKTAAIGTIIALLLASLLTLFLARDHSSPTQNAAPDSKEAWKALQQAASLEDIDASEELFEAMMREGENVGVAYAGLCATALRRFEQSRRDADLVVAEGNCTAATELDTDTAFTAEANGWLALHTGEPARAMELFQRAITLAKDNATARLGLAAVLESQGRIDEAEQILLEAAVDRPGLWRAQSALGLLLQRMGRSEESIRRFELALELSPDNISVLNNMGIGYLFDQQYGQAIKAWNRVLEITPDADQGATLTNVGSAYYLMRDFAAARLAFEKASRLLGDDYRAWSNLADTLVALDEADAAQLAYRRMLDRTMLILGQNSANSHALAAAAAAKSALGDATWREDIATALRQLPEDAEIRRLAALCFIRANEDDAAKRHYAESLKLGYPEFLLAADYQFDAISSDTD